MSQGKIPLIGWVFIALMFISGTTGALVYKQLCLTKAPVKFSSDPVYFDHPYIMTFFMYTGNVVYVFIELIDKKCNQSRKQKEYQGSGFNLQTYFGFFSPMMIDVIGSTMYNISLKFALVSICQMVRNCSVLFVALFSAICFRSYRQHFDLPQAIGLLLVICGMLVICLVSYYKDDKQSSAPNNMLGIFICIVSSAFSSVVFVIEEALFRNVKINGMQAISSEGSFGCTIYIFLLFTLNYTYNSSTNEPIESMSYFSYQLMENKLLILFIVLYILSIVFYGWSCLETTNRVNSVTRSMFDSSKTLLVWVFSLIFGWEKPDTLGTSMKLLGYIVMCIGIAIYNRVVAWVPFLREVNKIDSRQTDEVEHLIQSGTDEDQ